MSFLTCLPEMVNATFKYMLEKANGLLSDFLMAVFIVLHITHKHFSYRNSKIYFRSRGC